MIIKYTIYVILIFAYLWWSISSIKDGYRTWKHYDRWTQSELFDSWLLFHTILLGIWVFVKFFTILIG